MRVTVTHLEHTDGHDKAYRVFEHAGTATFSWGRRGVFRSWKKNQSVYLARDQVWAKEAKGYRQLFTVSFEAPDSVVAACDERLHGLADDAWATVNAKRASVKHNAAGAGGLLAVADWGAVQIAQPFVVKILDLTGTLLCVSDDKAVFSVPCNVADVANTIDRVHSKPGGAICAHQVQSLDVEVLATALKLWQPGATGMLGSFAQALKSAVLVG